MTIQELISELEQYDKELEIHVYSITNDKDATISHIGRGNDEDGMLETFVSICTEDTGVESEKPKLASNEPLIKIKPNDYKPVTEIRPEVVQMICSAFIGGRKFRPYTHSWKCYHAATKWVSAYLGRGSFEDTPRNDNFQINDCEMDKAIELLQDAGYYIFSHKENNGFVEIVCSEKPYYQDNGIFYDRMYTYTEHID